jgi:hypothetical protein
MCRSITLSGRTLGRTVACLAVVSGCLAVTVSVASAHTPPTSRPALAGSWDGAVQGSSAFVAIVVGQHETAGRRIVLAYVCNGATGRGASRATIVEWFHGQTSARHFVLTSTDGSRLNVTISKGKATGTVAYPGPSPATKSFAAVATKGLAGLYRGQKTVNGKTYLGGLIVLNDKRGRGALTTSSSTVLLVEWNGLGRAHPTATFADPVTVTLTRVGITSDIVARTGGTQELALVAAGGREIVEQGTIACTKVGEPLRVAVSLSQPGTGAYAAGVWSARCRVAVNDDSGLFASWRLVLRASGVGRFNVGDGLLVVTYSRGDPLVVIFDGASHIQLFPQLSGDSFPAWVIALIAAAALILLAAVAARPRAREVSPA